MPFSPSACQHVLKYPVKTRVNLQRRVVINLPEHIRCEPWQVGVDNETWVIVQCVSLDFLAHTPADRGAAEYPQCGPKGTNRACAIYQWSGRIKESRRIGGLEAFDTPYPHQVPLEFKLYHAAFRRSTLSREDADANFHQTGRDERKGCQIAQCAIDYATGALG